MNTEAVAFILIILVISASVFITVSNMNKTVQELSNTVSSISAELNTIKQAINMTEDYRVLLSLLGPLALEKLEKAIVLEDYIIHVVEGVGAGDILAPHLYDWFFDGVDDYLVIGLQPDGSGNIFSVYGWSGITTVERVNIVDPNIVSSRKTSMIGDAWVDRPALFNTMISYSPYGFNVRINLRAPDGSQVFLQTRVTQAENKTAEITKTFSLADRTFRIYVNGSLFYSAQNNNTSILEWNPATATYPRRYQRFVLGASTELMEHLNLYQSYLLIYSRALSDAEIQTIYNAKVVNTSSLEILIDPTFTINNADFYNLGRYNTTIRAYNGVNRIKANETWVWTLRNATADPGVWLRFFPSGTLIVYRTGEIEKITSTEYYTNRTDIMLIMIPKEAIG